MPRPSFIVKLRGTKYRVRVSSSNKYQTFTVLIVCVFVLTCGLFMPGSVRTVGHAEMLFHSQLISFGGVRLILDRLSFRFRAPRPSHKCHCMRELQAKFTVTLTLNFGIIILTQQITFSLEPGDMGCIWRRQIRSQFLRCVQYWAAFACTKSAYFV